MACNVYSMMLLNAHNCFKTQEVWNKTVEDDPRMLQFIIDCCETQQKCEKVWNSKWKYHTYKEYTYSRDGNI